MADEKTRARIADLREYATALRASVHVHHTGADLIEQAADTISALTVPDGDARERLLQLITEYMPGREGIPKVQDVWLADAILAAFPVLGRDIAGEIEAETMDELRKLIPAGWQMLSVRQA
ncbi:MULTISPECIES: hypothetical protein [unclassified Leucobacter]|uniref:hypothetical protein n=1 Tax=unclassified Leucobacter TaxID=2621730 RepID=UPI003017C471